MTLRTELRRERRPRSRSRGASGGVTNTDGVPLNSPNKLQARSGLSRHAGRGLECRTDGSRPRRPHRSVPDRRTLGLPRRCDYPVMIGRRPPPRGSGRPSSINLGMRTLGMTSGSTRRRFLEATGAAVGMAGLGGDWDAIAGQAPAAGTGPAPAPGTRPRVAALASVYFYLSHAYHIVGRFLDGFPVYDGRPEPLHRPPFEIASLFIEQVPPATDLGRAKAQKFGVRLSPTIADALTLGTGKLAVDAVLLIAEHGEYPYNEKLQKLYPRGKYFREVLDVFGASGRAVPVFIDKHLSYSRTEAERDDQGRRGAGGAADGRLEPAGDLAASPAGDPPGAEVPRGRGRLARRPGDLRLPRPGDAPVHGRAPRPRRQAAGGGRGDLPGGRRRLGGRRQGRLVVGAPAARPGPQPHGQPRRHPPEHPRLPPTRRAPKGDVPTKFAGPVAFLSNTSTASAPR